MKTILFIIALTFSFIGFCQDLVYKFDGKITNIDNQKMEAGVTVSILVGGKVVASSVSASNGKFELKYTAPPKLNCQLVYSKTGFVSKKLVFDAAKMNAEDIPGGSEVATSASMSMFAVRPDVDFSFLNTEPVATFFWDEAGHVMNFDGPAMLKTKKKIDDLLAGVVDPAINAKYQAAVGAGANLLSQKKYEEALVKYEEANALKPKEALPIAKIAEIDKLMANQEKENLAGEQADLEYKNLITAADNLRDQKKYPESIAKYNEAIKKKDESYPKGEIAKINAITKAAADKVAADKAAADKAAADKLAADKAAADKAAADKLAASNKAAADKAAADKLAADKLAADKAAADKLAADKLAASNLAAQNAQKAKIDKLIVDGNGLFAKTDFAGSKLKFEEVLREDSSNAIAIAKLKEINAKLDSAKGQAEKDAQFLALKQEGMGLATSKKYKEAKIILNQANDMKGDDAAVKAKLVEIDKILKETEDKAAVDEEYKKLISEATSLESSKNYDGAIGKYKEALAKKPMEVLPKNKITELEKLKAGLASQGQAEAQKTALYNENMAKGAKSFLDKKYQQALTDFQNALSVKPGDAAAKAKIAETQQILDDLANASNQDAEAKKNFNKLVADADKLFKLEKYLDAKALYEKALIIESSNATILKQVAECDRLEKEKSNVVENNNYKKIIGAADKNFNDKDYLKAKEYYERALSFKPTDPYPKAKLLEIDGILNPKAVVATPVLNLEGEKLLPLGVPFDKEDIDGLAALKQAEIDREIARNNKVSDKGAKANTVFNEYSDQKNIDHLENVAKVEEIKTSINNTVESNLNDHQKVIDLTADVVKEQIDRTTADENFETTDHLQMDEKLNQVSIENRESYLGREEGYKDATEKLKVQNTEFSKVSTQQDVDKNNLLIETHQQNIIVEKDIESKHGNDDVSRLALEVVIAESTDKTRTVQEEKVSENVSNSLDVKQKLVDIDKNIVHKGVEDEVKGVSLNHDLEIVKNKIQSEEEIESKKDIQTGMDQTSKMVDLNKQLFEEAEVLKGDQQNSNEQLKLSKKTLQDNSIDVYNKEMVKYLANSNELKEKEVTTNALTAVSSEKLIENNGLLSNRSKSIEESSVAQELEKTNKLLESTKSIHDKQKDETIVKPIIANSVGKEYPEGVSQEAFTQNDENGLMKAIITRRVVVIQGKGDVYVKTQTLQSITYSKNGSPTTERVWQKETQGPQLVKNY